MNKALSQLLIFIIVFFVCWGILSRVNFTGLFHVAELKAVNEEKLGALLRESIYSTETIMKDSLLVAVVDSMKQKICKANGLAGDSIKIFIIEEQEVNAFALPGNNLVIHSGLIAYCKTPDELASVIAHETAHMEHHHVMKKLVKEVGVAVLFNLLGGDNARVVREIAGTLSSSAYDRDLERDADSTAVNYLENTHVDPAQFANLLLRFAKKTNDSPRELYWISSHPESKERAGIVLQLKGKSKQNYQPVLSEAAWLEAQKRVK